MNFAKNLMTACFVFMVASPMVIADGTAADDVKSNSATSNTSQDSNISKDSNTSKDSKSSNNSRNDSQANTQALSGSVKAIDVEAGEALRQMGDCLKKIERASLELMGEATRQNYIAVGDPDVIGTMIIPAMPSETGVMAVGPYLPIRKGWFDYYMNQMASLFPIYADYVDALVMPPTTKTQATALLDQMRQPFADSKARYMELYRFKKQLSKVSNKKVAVICVQIHDDMDKMDKLRRQVFDLLKSSEKKD